VQRSFFGLKLAIWALLGFEINSGGFLLDRRILGGHLTLSPLLPGALEIL